MVSVVAAATMTITTVTETTTLSWRHTVTGVAASKIASAPPVTVVPSAAAVTPIK